MATLGHYSIHVLLHKRGLSSVYSARSAARPGKEFAIKVFQPPSFWEEKTKNQVEGFLDSAKVQQKVASTGARYWAPVYEHGSAKEGSYYVTDPYACSAQELINGHVRLSAGALHNIVTSVVSGLLELKQALGRPHGNLKPSNILISQHSDLPNAEVVLCDPVASQHLDPEVHWAADVRDVAELIYQLVTHSSSPMLDHRQIPASEQWRALGKSAEDWRSLCGRLIDAALQRTGKDLAQLAQELAAMEPQTKSPIRRKWVIIGGALSIVVMAGFIVGWFCLRKPLPVNIEGNKYWIDSLYGPPPRPLPAEFDDKLVICRWILVEDIDNLASDPTSKTYNEQEKAKDYANNYLDRNGRGPDKLRKLKEGLIREFREFLGDYGYDEKKEDWSAKYKDNVWPRLILVNDAAKRFKEPFQTAYNTLHSRRKGVKPPIALTKNEGYDIAKSIANNIQEIISIDNRVLDKELMVRWDVNIPGRCEELQEMKAGADPNLVLQVNELLREINDRSAIAGKKLNETASYIDGIYDRCVNLRLGLINVTLADGRQKWISETLSSVEFRVPVFHKAWLAYTRNVLAESRHVELVNNLDNFIKVRTQVEDVKAELEKSRDELLKAAKTLTPGQRAWYDKIEGIATPSGDPNAENTKRFCEDWAREGPQVARDFANVETWFNACYLLDDKPPDSNGRAVRFVFVSGIEKLNEFVSDANSQPKELKVLIGRVDRLNEIAEELNTDELVKIAGSDNSQPEAIFAAWARIADPNVSGKWPKNAAVEEADVRTKLKEFVDFNNLPKDDLRRNRFKQACDEYDGPVPPPEPDRLLISIKKHQEQIKAKNIGVDDRILTHISELRIDESATKAEKDHLNLIVGKLSQFIADPNWPGRYDRTGLAKDPGYPDDINDVDGWIRLAKLYSWIPNDPRNKQACEDEYRKIENVILKTQLLEAQGKIRNPGALKAAIEDYNITKATLNNEILPLAAIMKYNDDIAKYPGLLRKLSDHYSAIRRHIKPDRFAHLEIDGNALLFRSEDAKLNGSSLFTYYMPLVPAVDSWDKVWNWNIGTDGDYDRAFKDRFELDKQGNAWPRYIYSNIRGTRLRSGEPGAIFIYVTSDPAERIPPFYMALHETTNEQYDMFLKQPDIKSNIRFDDLDNSVRYVDGGESIMLINPYSEIPGPCPRLYKSDQLVLSRERFDYPVTYVTHYGAFAYANSLKASLPTTGQFRAAIEFANSRGLNQRKAHLRSSAWKMAMEAYDPQKATNDREPLGVDEDRDTSKTVPDTGYQWWPQSVITNGSGIGDLEGNVWEWCKDGSSYILYGGSCLASPGMKSVRLKADTDTGCDAGFRVVVNIPQIQN